MYYTTVSLSMDMICTMDMICEIWKRSPIHNIELLPLLFIPYNNNIIIHVQSCCKHIMVMGAFEINEARDIVDTPMQILNPSMCTRQHGQVLLHSHTMVSNAPCACRDTKLSTEIHRKWKCLKPIIDGRGMPKTLKVFLPL